MGELTVFAGLAVLAACEERELPKLEPEGSVPTRAARIIGPTGGSVALGPVVLRVPAGALDQPIQLAITRTDERAPGGFLAYSAIYLFEPAGTRFAASASVSIDVSQWALEGQLFWSEDGVSYAALPGVATGDGLVSAPIRHFSRGFGGRTSSEDAGSGCPASCDSQRVDSDCAGCAGAEKCFVDPYGTSTRFGSCVASIPICPASCDSTRGDQDCAACAPESVCLTDTYPANRFGICTVPHCPSTCDSYRGDLDCSACPNARRCVIETYGPNRFGTCKP